MSQVPEQRRSRLEQLLAAGLAELTGTQEGEIGRRAGCDRAPASYAQRRLWFLDRLQPESRAYLVPAMMKLIGPLETEALRESVRALIARHETLRTTFSDDTGQLQQIVSDRADLEVEFVDLSARSPAAREEAWLRQLDPDAHEPFDLRRGPMVRARLFRWAPEEHRLLILLHHIALDGWSLGLLVHDLAALYAARVERGPDPEPPMLTYRDYTIWQHDRVTGHDLDSQLDYWRQQLNGLRPTEIAGDRPRPTVLGWRGSRRYVTLSRETTEAVHATAKRTGGSAFAVLLAAFNALLQRICGHEEIVVGTPIAARTRPETEQIVGMIANTLVLRTDLSGDPGFDELVGRCREVVLDAYGHQDIPFELLVEHLRPERDPSRQPLFQIAFAMQNLPPFSRVEAGPLTFETLDMVGEVAKFDLSVLVSEVEGELRCEFEYNTDLFEAATIDRLMAQYRAALTDALARPHTRVSALTLIEERERKELLGRWSGRRRAFGPELVPELIARRVAEAPQAIAVSAAGRRLTYGELDTAANQVAAHLATLGCRAGDRVAICAHRSVELVIAVLGVMRAGGCYVPLDPAHPAERLAQLVADCGAICVLTEADVRRSASLEACALTPVQRHPRQPAYVVYTSGSTGFPKGVVVEHAGLANLVQWHLERYQLSGTDRATLVASPGFDASAWEIWTALAAGAALHIPGDEVRADPAALADWFAEEGITTAFLPTALAEAVLTEPALRKAPLRHLLTGGDALTRVPLDWTDGTLVNHYGPTENTVVATAAEVLSSRPSIGSAIDNVLVYVLDAVREPVPVGVPGELHVGGAQVASGYLGDPAKTAERFLPDPFSGVPGSRMYRTGDLVRWKASEGQLDFLGRADSQVKIRGIRLELGEVEAAIRAHPGVREAVVVVRGSDPLRRDLVAVVELADMSASPDELRSAVRRRLPAHMVPAGFVVVDRIPLNASGKVDRRAVSVPDNASLAVRRVAEPPSTPAEVTVAQIWGELLGLEQIDRRDNFFELGGHSFLALSLQQRLESRFAEADVSVVDIFQHPTLSALAAHVDSAGTDRSAPIAQEARKYADQRRRALRRRSNVREESP